MTEPAEVAQPTEPFANDPWAPFADVVVDQPLPGTINDASGRWYLIDDVKCLSVTSSLDLLGGEALQRWASGLGFSYTYAQLPLVVASGLLDECGRSWARCQHPKDERCSKCPCRRCKRCLYRTALGLPMEEMNRRAREGSAAHKYAEVWLETGQEIDVDPAVLPYVESFRIFVKVYDIRPGDQVMVEGRCIDPKNRLAGTTDGIIRIYPRTQEGIRLIARALQVPISKVAAEQLEADFMVDYKTKQKERRADMKFMPKHALQQAAYIGCPEIYFHETGERFPMPHVDGALLIFLGLGELKVGLLDAGPKTRAAFLNLHKFALWVAEQAPAAISQDFKPIPPEPGQARKAPARRAPRKAAAPAVTNAADLPMTAAAKAVQARIAPAVPENKDGRLFNDGNDVKPLPF